MKKRYQKINPPLQWSILVITGPTREIKGIIDAELSEMFNEIKTFDITDDYGEFPDTTGYTADNWEKMSSQVEDSNLYPFMTRAMDAVLEFVNRRWNTADKLGYQNLERHSHWPKFGGKIFAVTGHVVCTPQVPWMQ